jgi:hypothetical protein
MRRQKILGFTAVAAFALVLGHGIAVAQSQAQQAPAPPDANAGLVRQVNLSPQEELAKSESLLSQMDSSRGVVRRQLEQARAQRDVVKTLCLNDKLNQLDVAIRSARERRQALEAAVQRADSDLANHEFTILDVLHKRANQLTAEANQCVGSDTTFIGENQVQATIDPGIPQAPDVWEGPNAGVVVQPPPCASCVK